MSGFNFGNTGGLGSTTTGGGFSFGAAASTPAAAGTGGFTLGSALGAAAPAATTTTAAMGGLGGGLFAQKPATGGFSFNTPVAGATAPATGLSLSIPSSTAASTGFSLAFNKPSASATPFSLTTASTMPMGGGLTLGSVQTSTAPQVASTGFGLNLGGAVSSMAPVSMGLTLGSSLFPSTMASGLGQAFPGAGGLTLGSLVAAPAPSLGLGGVDFSTSSEKKSDKLSGARPEDSKALKDENLPPVICQDVDNFQKFVKEQKQVQEDISRMSSKAMAKVQDDIRSLKKQLSLSTSGLQRNALAIDKLKMETAQELKNADIPLRTQKTPPGLQHENTAPSDYFRGLVEQFEVQLQQYRQQIEELENHLTTQGSGAHITPQDLSLAMQKLYQTFVALAAQLQSVHENVKILKHQYLAYRRAFLEDSTDVFESKRQASRKWQGSHRLTTGPAPFSSVPNAAAVAMAATLSQQQQPAPGFGSSSTTGFNFSNPGITASAGLTFGVSNPPTAGFGTGGPLLQLKKPPVGNKRGKR
ncbi:nucleoporin p58/p45-like isoform X3 [Osmerus eperlanus]|uniref:nucleoporin p58/p45-like isoform X3 n=1 Tax=Osmerus eperlanus TaxID=29151 RepID=UPI002E129C9F